ncbi:MAG: hypothetical protein ACOYNZ_06420 [Rhodoferax sp.]
MTHIAIRLVLLLLSALLTSGVNAADLRKIAVLALMGDTLAVVNHRPEVGSNLDRNQYSSLPTGASAIDNMMVGEAIEAVKRVGLPGSPEIQAVKYPGKHEATRWFEGTRFAPPTELGSAMTELGATHLLFITPYRAPSMLRTASSSVGSGHLEGLGFYIDREQRLRRADTGEVGVGFLAPYAYFKVFLIDLASGELEREQAIAASSTVSVARNKNGIDPWDSLDAAQKVSAIRRLIRRELDRVVPKLLR